MIFATTGTQKFQFNRLLKGVDKAIETGIITEKVFAQTGLRFTSLSIIIQTVPAC